MFSRRRYPVEKRSQEQGSRSPTRESSIAPPPTSEQSNLELNPSRWGRLEPRVEAHSRQWTGVLLSEFLRDPWSFPMGRQQSRMASSKLSYSSRNRGWFKARQS